MKPENKCKNNKKLDLSGIVTIFSILIVLVAVVLKLVASDEQAISPVTETTEMPQAGYTNMMMADVIASIKQQIASAKCSHTEGSNEYVLSGFAHTSSVTIIAATDINGSLSGITVKCELQTVADEGKGGALNEIYEASLTRYQDYRTDMSTTYNAIISALLQCQNPESALIAQEIDNAVFDDSIVNHAMSSLRYTIHADRDAEILYATFIIID